MSFSSIGIALLLLLSIGLIWFFLYYFGNPVIENPDGIAKVEGNCGDTMEIGLKITNNKISSTHYWSNGCSISKRCIEAAAILSHHKSLDEVKKINMISIMEVVGELPETHLHCAQLAETTLQKSLENYLAKSAIAKNER